MGVFLILLLSGERNFGVRLNKPFTLRGAIDVPPFTGTHADLLIIVIINFLRNTQKENSFEVFHKLITTGNYRLQSLFECLLTIIVNGWVMLDTIDIIYRVIFSIPISEIPFNDDCQQTRASC